MRVNGFRCDTCCKEHLLDPTLVLHSYYQAMPAEWFLLSQGGPEQDKEPWLFCSTACLLQWAEKQVALVHDDYPKVRQELGEVPRNRLMQGNWLPGDEE